MPPAAADPDPDPDAVGAINAAAMHCIEVRKDRASCMQAL